ncbi:hypothetical protein R3P38DRAFT_3231155 [Favolaschia claudopus]|uniref:Uncharacterized protein n=1 Tax=Favolaschia claudopus TaxID=2862362 RepID=A0AAV9ZL67_9AGAR
MDPFTRREQLRSLFSNNGNMISVPNFHSFWGRTTGSGSGGVHIPGDSIMMDSTSAPPDGAMEGSSSSSRSRYHQQQYQQQQQVQQMQMQQLQMQHQQQMQTQMQQGAPKYMADFSKALAFEVKILLEEVGKLRDEKRALQFEIEELRGIRARHSAGIEGGGGGYGIGMGGAAELGWAALQALEGGPPAPDERPPSPPAPAPGGWRVVHPPPAPRRKATPAAKQIVAPTPAPAPPPPPPADTGPAWSHWRPNPLLSPTGAGAGAGEVVVASPVDREGIFGARTPPPGGESGGKKGKGAAAPPAPASAPAPAAPPATMRIAPPVVQPSAPPPPPVVPPPMMTASKPQNQGNANRGGGKGKKKR